MENEYRKLLNQVRETRKQLEKRESPDLEQPEEETSGVEENPAAETTPKEPEKKEAVTDNTKEEQKFSLRKATVSKEHLGLKKWPPEEVLLGLNEKEVTTTIEKNEKPRQKEKATVIQTLITKILNSGIYKDPEIKIADVEVENFRSNLKDFPFNLTYTSPEHGKVTVKGILRAPSGKREAFEVEVVSKNIKAGNMLKNVALSAQGDKEIIAASLQKKIQEVINVMQTTYFKDTIIEIIE